MAEHLKNMRKFDFKIDQYDNDPYSKNPLLKFRISKIKRRKQIEAIKRRAAIVSLTLFQQNPIF